MSQDALSDLAPPEWDRRPRAAATRIREALTSIIDEETSVDIGAGEDFADLWATIDGREYFITVRASNRQIKSEMQ